MASRFYRNRNDKVGIMNSKKIRPETAAALDAIFSPVMPKHEMSKHMSLIATGVLMVLRQIEGDEFMLGYLQGAIDDVQHGQGRAH
jgi:hypothetical protein